MQSHNFTIILTLMSLGFFGGFSHCIGMCGPFVLSQVSSNLKNISLNNYSTFQKLRGMALMPYHLGRITTYSFIGFFCSAITTNLKDIVNFNRLSGFLLLIASLFFLQKFFEDKLFVRKINLEQRINFKIKLPKFKMAAHINLLLQRLFKNPQGFNGFLLGIILGFIPCGLLYGAFALAATVKPPLLAAFAMTMFGIMTIPALLASAFGGYVFFKANNNNFKIFSKIIILINIATLFILGVGLILV